jgi:transmembrane protein bioY
VALYLLVGFAGLPIFAKGGAGLGSLASPSAGYLLGFLPFAAIAGTLAYLFTRNTRSVGATFLMALLANFCGFVVLTACGIAGMMVNAHMSFIAAFNAAMVFVPWDLVKSVIAVLVGLSVRRAFPSLTSTQR